MAGPLIHSNSLLYWTLLNHYFPTVTEYGYASGQGVKRFNFATAWEMNDVRFACKKGPNQEARIRSSAEKTGPKM